jgi:hypothetical protein
MDKEALIKAIEQIYTAAFAMLERLPDHAERIVAAYEKGGVEGVRIETLRITNEQALGIAATVHHLTAETPARQGTDRAH